jgi:phosphonate degradation associated HDIG domain protein
MSQATVDQVFALLEGARRAGYDGERVTQLEHALQAAELAQRAGASVAEVVAALLHDIGHVCAGRDAARMGDCGVAQHEAIGAAYLAELGFCPEVTELVRGHVGAKRYLVATRKTYGDRLSDASRTTLEHQGGPMSPEECAAFEASPHFQAILELRRRDEAAKVPGREVPLLDVYRPLVERCLQVDP